jgi:ribonuclease PH
MIPEDVFLPRIAALSVGMVGGHVLVDLTAEESAAAEFSGNLVFDHELKLVEIRAAGESLSLDIAEFMGLIEAGRSGVALIYHDKNYQR